MYMNIGTIIKDLRKKAGLSQGELAEVCDLSQSYLSQVEKNKRDPHFSTLTTIAAQLSIPLPVLVFLALDEEDIPEKKKEAFQILFPSIRAFLIELFPRASEALKN